jgi:hypothetical protein
MSAVRQGIANQLKAMMANWELPTPSMDQFNRMLRLLAKWRSYALTQTYFAHHGRVILDGPFKGMVYVSEATEGALLPRLLGTYEHELRPHLDRLGGEWLHSVIDVGCA